MGKVKKLDENDIRKLMEENKKLREKKYLEDSKKRLQKIIEKKIQTAFIGALAEFEKGFQDWWTEDFKDEWEQVRINILNNGNNQIRAIRNELEQYTVKWNRYVTTFILKQQTKTDSDSN